MQINPQVAYFVFFFFFEIFFLKRLNEALKEKKKL